jgi:hypothetical protein
MNGFGASQLYIIDAAMRTADPRNAHLIMAISRLQLKACLEPERMAVTQSHVSFAVLRRRKLNRLMVFA